MNKIIKERDTIIEPLQIQSEINLSEVKSAILSKRLCSIEECVSVINPSLKNMENPFNMADMRKGAERLIKALENKEKIVCVVDYDQDGIASGAVLKKGLDLFKAYDSLFEIFVTNRHEDGYGFSQGAASKVLQKRPNLIITADLGSSDGHNIDWYLSQENGKNTDFVITDHHHISETTPPKNSYAFINPQRKDSVYKDRTICGAVVAFNFMLAVKMIYKERKNELGDVDIKSIMDFTAPATIADCMDLRSEINRYLINFGIKRMNEGTRAAWRVLRKKLCKNESELIKTDTIAFQLAPRINAVSRMGGDGLDALKFLTTIDEQLSEELYIKITETNEDRKESQNQGFEMADIIAQELNMKGYFGLVILIENIEHGVAGIVASKIVEKHGKPVIVLGKNKEGNFVGSGRSIDGFDLRNAVVKTQEKRKTLIKFGGHSAAIGLSMSESDYDKFIEDFNDIVKLKYVSLENLKPVLKYDILINNADEINIGLFDEISTLEPYGQNFPRPVFAARAKIKTLEWTNKGEGKHLKIIATDQNNNNFPLAMWFNATSYLNKEKLEEVDLIGKEKTIIFELMESNFRRERSIQINIVYIS